MCNRLYKIGFVFKYALPHWTTKWQQLPVWCTFFKGPISDQNKKCMCSIQSLALLILSHASKVILSTVEILIPNLTSCSEYPIRRALGSLHLMLSYNSSMWIYVKRMAETYGWNNLTKHDNVRTVSRSSLLYNAWWFGNTLSSRRVTHSPTLRENAYLVEDAPSTLWCLCNLLEGLCGSWFSQTIYKILQKRVWTFVKWHV